ncbi:hypothetical protein QQ045_022668 [Rhodiola kirilowii]
MEGHDAHYLDAEHHDLWRYICTIDSYYLSIHPATCINIPEWKVAQRLIAMAVNVRGEGGTDHMPTLLETGVKEKCIAAKTRRMERVQDGAPSVELDLDATEE